MIIKDFVQQELDYFRKECNFVGMEKTMFDKRADGYTLEEIADLLNISIDSARKLSVKVNNKINKVVHK